MIHKEYNLDDFDKSLAENLENERRIKEGMNNGHYVESSENDNDSIQSEIIEEENDLESSPNSK